MTKLKYRMRTKVSKVLEIIHSEAVDQITSEAHEESNYFETFKDYFSNFSYV